LAEINIPEKGQLGYGSAKRILQRKIEDRIVTIKEYKFRIKKASIKNLFFRNPNLNQTNIFIISVLLISVGYDA